MKKSKISNYGKVAILACLVSAIVIFISPLPFSQTQTIVFKIVVGIIVSVIIFLIVSLLKVSADTSAAEELKEKAALEVKTQPPQ